MALRLPGKGNFKPVKPIRRPAPKPSASSQAAGSSAPSQAAPSQSQAPPLLAEDQTVAVKSTPTQKPSASQLPPSLKPTTQELKTQEVPPSQPKPSVSTQRPTSQPKPPASQPKPSVSDAQPGSSTLVPQPKPIDEPPAVAPVRESDTPAIPPEVASRPVSTTPHLNNARALPGRPPKPKFTPNRQPTQKKTKALLVAAATSGPSDPSSPRPIHHRRRGGTASVASTVRGDDDVRMEDVSVVPPVVAVALDVPPPVVAAVASSQETVAVDAVAGPSIGTQETRPTKGADDAATLAAALVASIQPHSEPPLPGPRRKRRPRKVIDLDAQPAPTKRRRQTPRRSPSIPAESDELEDDDEGLPEPTGLEGMSGRSQRGASASRRVASTPRQFTFSHPELDGVDEDGRVGQLEFNPAVAKLSDLATVSEGRVSARTIKLHQFQRAQEESKQRGRAARVEANWRRLQVVRRKARKLKNIARAQRRLDATRRGDDPDTAVSDDSVDSEEEYEPVPDRLTPPSSPKAAERVEPIHFERPPEGEEEVPEAMDDDEEDVEGLGAAHRAMQAEEDEEIGEELEDFQLPVEADGEDGDEFSGLVANNFRTGHLDDNVGWVDTTEDAAMALLRKNEDNMKRIRDGHDGRPVEIVDNETTFVNYSTWGKKVSNERWTTEETELFFDVLRETGENYTLMKAYFPGRNVRQLKKKGHRENKMNPGRMTECILNRKSMDKEYLAKSSGFKVAENYAREVEFLDEVAREKERIISLGPLVPADEADDGPAGFNPEFDGLP